MESEALLASEHVDGAVPRGRTSHAALRPVGRRATLLLRRGGRPDDVLREREMPRTEPTDERGENATRFTTESSVADEARFATGDSRLYDARRGAWQ